LAKRTGLPESRSGTWLIATELAEPSSDDFPPFAAFWSVRGRSAADRRFLASRRTISRRLSRSWRPGADLQPIVASWRPAGRFPAGNRVQGTAPVR
jgi:hypothetical protein